MLRLQLLFDWASHALTGYYSKKVELPQEVVAGLWAYLDDILHSKNLQNVLSTGRSLSLRLAVAQVSDHIIFLFIYLRKRFLVYFSVMFSFFECMSEYSPSCLCLVTRLLMSGSWNVLLEHAL